MEASYRLRSFPRKESGRLWSAMGLIPSGPLALKAEKSIKAFRTRDSVRQAAFCGLNLRLLVTSALWISVVLSGKVALVRISRLSSGVVAMLPSVRFSSPRLNLGW